MAQRIYRKKNFKKKKRNIILFLKILGAVLFVSLFASLFLFILNIRDLPRPEKFTEGIIPQSTKIYDREGKVILYEIAGEEKRTIVPLSEIPEYLRLAVIAVEDKNFYEHHGLDFKAILRAILTDLKLRQPIQGGSTITQQLIRSYFLTTKKTLKRKTREIVLTLETERRYSKDQILEWYLNLIPFGSNLYGVEAASQTFFGKHISDISLEEAAVLAAIIKAPSYFWPEGPHLEELLARKDYVLDRMAAERYLEKEIAEKTKKEEIKFVEKKTEIKAPYFTLWVKQQLEEKYGGKDFLERSGLKIFTSLDWKMQEIAQDVVEKGIETNKNYNAHNAGLVAISPKTGEILAMTVGTGDYYATSEPESCQSGVNCLFDPQFNVVVGTKESPGRQPGSALKPFIYATAFKKGYDDKTIVVDELTNFGIWGGKEYIPQNYDGRFRGPVTLRQGLAQSLNVPSVKVFLYLAGLEDSVKTAQDCGITTLNPPYGPSIVLGGKEVNLLEITSAYGVFANDGLRLPPVSILKIEDSSGNIIEENKKTPKRVLENKVARLINNILSDNEARAPIFGLKSPLYFENYQVAVKTGTTQDYRDGWTIGYTPSLSVGVWVGNNNNVSMSKEPGVVLAGPIWHNFMAEALKKFPKEEFEKPEEILTQFYRH
jgi:penicillin-binding protein 1A